MLEPSRDRLDYAEILRKPAPDFELTAAIACTYSLDLSALLAALLPLGFEGDAANECRNNPVFALHALKKLLPKLAVFCDCASVKVPDLKQNRLLALLDRAVYPVKHKTAFHPKFWLLKFSRQDEVRYRLVVLSKNITFDRSWDMALTLDGEPKKNANGEPLSSILQMFYKKQGDKSKRPNILSGLIKEIRNVSFFNDEVKPEDLCFIPFGTDFQVRDEYLLNNKATFQRLLVISPFLAKETAEQLFKRGRENSEKILISRKMALSAFSSDDLPQVNCYCMKDEVIDGERSEYLNDAPLHIQQEDIHAKFYMFQQYQGHAPYIYLGSANLTQNGISSKNVELLVRFKLSRKNVFDDICKELLPSKHSIFEPYQFTVPIEKSDAEKLHDLLEKSYRELSLGTFSSTVTVDEDKYQIAITFSGKMAKDCSCQIAPLNGEYQMLVPETEITFNSLTAENMSDFYRVKLDKDGEKIERLLVIDTLSKLPRLVESREILLEESCLKKSEDLLEYLSYMLAENAYPIAVSRMVQLCKYGIANQQYNSISSALYEKMLYWAATDKSRLLEMKNVIHHRSSNNNTVNDILNLCETFYRIAGGEK